MEKVKKYGKFLIPPAIAIAITLILYAIKGIYPFGGMTVAHADMGQSYETFYHLLWDILRGGKSLFYSYTLGSGSNVFGGVLLDGFASPFAWLIALFKRENIIYAFSYLLLIRIAFIALSTYIFFDKIYKKSENEGSSLEFWKVLFSVMYSLSAYVLISYTNIMWLDVVAIFPIFCLGVHRLLTQNKSGLFIVTLTLSLIISYYISYMILFFILSCLPFAVFFYAKKEDRKRVAGKIVIAVILSLFLSMFSFLPAFSQTMSSYRMAGQKATIVRNYEAGMKLTFLMLSSLSLLGTVSLVKYFKKDNTVKMLLLSLLICGVLPILFERINMLWHTGSHNSFPFRYGFIPIFVMMNCAMYYITKYYKNDKKFEIADVIFIILALIPIIILTPTTITEINQGQPAFRIKTNNFLSICIQTILFAYIIRELLKIEKIKLRNGLIAFVVIAEIILHGLAYIGVPESARGGAEHSDSSILVADNLLEKFKTNETELYRYRDPDQNLTENYPLVLDAPSMSTFLHVISKEQVETHSSLGYTRNYTKLGDAGGTPISDAILGVKYVFSNSELDGEIFKYDGTSKENINLYEYKNVLPYGIIYENNNDISTIPQADDVYATQNYVYKQLFNKTEDIIEKVDSERESISKDEKVETFKYKVNVNEKSYLYVYGSEEDTSLYSIKVNGETVKVPWINDYENTIYPYRYSNGLINLGKFENEEVEIEARSYKGKCNLKFATLSLEKYENAFADYKEECTKDIKIEGNKISIKIENAKAGQKLFLPITYDAGWTGTNNGETTNVNRTFNTYMSLELKEGTNEIELTFIPAKMKLGIKLSIATLVIILIYTFGIKRFIKKDGLLDKIIVNIGFGIYIVITVGFYLKVYVMCIIQSIKQWIS